MTDIQDKWYSVATVAEMFEVTQATVRVWVNQGKIEAIKLPTGTIRISETEIRKLANNKYGDDSA